MVRVESEKWFCNIFVCNSSVVGYKIFFNSFCSLFEILKMWCKLVVLIIMLLKFKFENKVLKLIVKVFIFFNMIVVNSNSF